MQETIELTNSVLGIGTVLAQLFSVLLVVVLVFRKQFAEIIRFATPYIIPFAFLITLSGSALTLVYSEVFGFIPCFLCWLQRAFLYPMVLLFGFALFKRFPSVWKYVLALSIPGMIVSLYQHYLQVGGVSLVPCPALPGAADCAKRLIFEFGYITFPLMAFSIFAMIALLMVIVRSKAEE